MIITWQAFIDETFISDFRGSFFVVLGKHYLVLQDMHFRTNRKFRWSTEAVVKCTNLSMFDFYKVYRLFQSEDYMIVEENNIIRSW